MGEKYLGGLDFTMDGNVLHMLEIYISINFNIINRFGLCKHMSDHFILCPWKRLQFDQQVPFFVLVGENLMFY